MIEELLDPIRSCARRIAVVVAHPDDEIIGAGGQLHRWPFVHFIHVTNGSPAALDDARNAGCSCQEEYAQLRRREFEGALQQLWLPVNRSHWLGFQDQDAAFHLLEIASGLRDAFRDLQPELIITHSFEGGHPDHDATAFAVGCAAGPIPIVEMAGYHATENGFCSGEFLGDTGVYARTLSIYEKRQKHRLFACFRSQTRTLSLFGTDTEKFRVSPGYDFSQPPHPGPLHYERYPWRMTSKLWTELVRDAA
jgi:LmbE family N-acetylglucosaminyl deacetylase